MSDASLLLQQVTRTCPITVVDFLTSGHFLVVGIQCNSNNSNVEAEVTPDNREQRVFVQAPLIGPLSSIPRDACVTIGQWWSPSPFFITSGSSSTGETRWVWFCLDYFSDFLYVLDIVFHIRTGYLEDGVLQTDATKLRNHYTNSTTFYMDILCLLPLDFLYLSIGFNSILRSFRLVKIYRFWAFMDRTERHTNYPNLFRSTSLIHYLLVIFHWNGCLYHIIYKNNGFGSKNWVFSDSETADVVKQYLQSYYWCTLALTTIGDLPRPRSKGEYLFVIIQLLFGLLLFATVLGHVANIVTSVSAARKEFQGE
ncbi:Cyclic nucleotide-gated channel cone photoreceptor subunit alpha [Anthophora plagiata]